MHQTSLLAIAKLIGVAFAAVRLEIRQDNNGRSRGVATQQGDGPKEKEERDENANGLQTTVDWKNDGRLLDGSHPPHRRKSRQSPVAPALNPTAVVLREGLRPASVAR